MDVSDLKSLFAEVKKRMIFGDAKTVLGEIVKALTGGGGH